MNPLTRGATDIYQRAAGPRMGNMLQKTSLPPTGASAPAAAAGVGQEAVASKQPAAADDKILATLEAEREYWSKRRPVERQKELDAMLKAELQARMKAQAVANAKRRLENGPDVLIEIDEDTGRATVLDAHRLDAGSTYGDYLAALRARNADRPTIIAPEALCPERGPVRAIEKCSCGCECCCEGYI